MQRLTSLIDVNHINTTWFPNDLNNLQEINNGRCFLWAYIAHGLYEHAQLCDIGAHAFIYSKLDKKFYDSEKPNGEADWVDLRATNFGQGCGCYVCGKGKRTYRSVDRFIESWSSSARRFKVDWDMLNLQIENELCKKLNTKTSA
jgi:hypothetical protein